MADEKLRQSTTPSTPAAPVSRTTEFVLGLLGGIFGIIGALFAMFVGGAAKNFEESGYEIGTNVSGDTIIGLGWAAVVISIVAIVAASMVKTRTKLAGWLMVICAVAGFIAIGGAYILAGPLLMIGGLMALLRGRGSKAA